MAQDTAPYKRSCPNNFRSSSPSTVIASARTEAELLHPVVIIRHMNMVVKREIRGIWTACNVKAAVPMITQTPIHQCLAAGDCKVKRSAKRQRKWKLADLQWIQRQ